jgi:hypothetical protein
MPPNPTPEPDSAAIAAHILQRLGEGGQPPEFGVRRINVGNESYLAVLDHEYFRRHLKVGSSFKLVQGYFGGGKTHFLYCVRELAWDRGFATAVVELSPAECPYDDSVKVYRAVVRRLSTRPRQALSRTDVGLPAVLREVVDRRVDAEEGDEKSVRNWLRREVARASCESHSFRQAVVAFCDAYLSQDFPRESRLGAWLLGEPVPIGDLRDAGIYESIDRSNGFTMLRCLTQMAVGVGLAGTALLFDEVDRTLSVSAKRSQVIGDNLRQVVDLCGRHQLPNTLFMYAVPPEFMRNVVPEYPALHQRLKSPVPLSVRSPQSVLIDLEQLDLEPADLLAELGVRLVDVFMEARGVALDRALQAANARALGRACSDAYFEVNHRRLFVKTWVDLLFHQLVDGEVTLTPERAEELVVAGYEALAAPPKSDDGDDFADF